MKTKRLFAFLTGALLSTSVACSDSNGDTPSDPPVHKLTPEEQAWWNKWDPIYDDIVGGDPLREMKHYLTAFNRYCYFFAEADGGYVRLRFEPNYYLGKTEKWTQDYRYTYSFQFEDEAQRATDDQSLWQKQFAEYESLCARYGDTDYNRTEFTWTIQRDYLADNIVSIEVRSAADFDAQHPAGTLLNDLCTLLSASPLPYIESGYTQTYDWDADPEGYAADPRHREYFPNAPENIGSTPFALPLADCRADDLRLMGDGKNTLCLLRFDRAPQAGAEVQPLTITLTDECGREIVVETTARWE